MKWSYLDFTGIDAPYQEPQNPDLVIDTSVVPIEHSIEMIVEKLAEQVSSLNFL